MITQSRIFRQIESLLANKISLGDFEDWLVRSSWNMHLESRNDAQELVWKIELSLAEYSSGHLDEAELRAELKGLVPVMILTGDLTPSDSSSTLSQKVAARR